MRHRKSGVKLNRTSSHRQAMFRNMVTSLLKYDRITTTDAKAKELRRWADHIVTLAKRGDLHARRLAMSIVREKDVVHKIFEAAPERFGAINGGYTRIIKVGRRPGDAAAMTVVELVSTDAPKPSKTKKSKPVATETKTFVPETPASLTDDEKEAPAVESKPTETEAAEGTAVQAPQPSSESVDPEK
jgi:large subunit ribosomal protein L17